MGIPQPASRVYSDEYQGNYAGLSGASARMQKAYHLIAKVAVTRDPVLILGESGTEKNWWRAPFTRRAHGATSHLYP